MFDEYLLALYIISSLLWLLCYISILLHRNFYFKEGEGKERRSRMSAERKGREGEGGRRWERQLEGGVDIDETL
jgi:hypothetical protein